MFHVKHRKDDTMKAILDYNDSFFVLRAKGTHNSTNICLDTTLRDIDTGIKTLERYDLTMFDRMSIATLLKDYKELLTLDCKTKEKE